MALLRAMLEIKGLDRGNGMIFALHVNHRLRGNESDEDATWCEQLCKSLEVPITVLMGNAAGRAEAEGDGIEAAARAERYEMLTQAAEGEGARYLATAHTRDDQVETVLLRMLRGSGLRGLSGVPRARVLSPVLTLVRPLLAVPRKLIEAYLADLRQSYRTDTSNLTSQFARNRVRNELLPLLRSEFNAEINEALVRLAEQAGAAQLVVEAQATALLAGCSVQGSERQLALQLEPLRGEPQFVVCEALRLAWRNSRLPEQAMTYQWWQRVAQLAQESAQGASLNLPGNVRASTADGRLTLQW